MKSGTLAWLLKDEWSMGNGQCPDCQGVPENWFGHPLHLTGEDIGHKAKCPRAAAIRELGGKPLMIGQFKPDVEYEPYVTPDGFFSTRVKKPGVPPCPIIRKMDEEFDREFYEIMTHEVMPK